MRRTDAARRHRRFIAVAAAMAGAIVVLLNSAVPWAEDQYERRGIEPEGATLAVIRAGHFVAEHIVLVLLGVVALLVLLWSAYGALDRPPGGRSAGPGA